MPRSLRFWRSSTGVLRTSVEREREFFIDNLLVRIHFIIVMIRWTGLAPWEFEFPFPGSFTSTFLGPLSMSCSSQSWCCLLLLYSGSAELYACSVVLWVCLCCFYCTLGLPSLA